VLPLLPLSVGKPSVWLLGVRAPGDSLVMRLAFVPFTGEELDDPLVFITQGLFLGASALHCRDP
jgi:hypothetical protein